MPRIVSRPPKSNGNLPLLDPQVVIFSPHWGEFFCAPGEGCSPRIANAWWYALEDARTRAPQWTFLDAHEVMGYVDGAAVCAALKRGALVGIR